jgi:hypothetical protein
MSSTFVSTERGPRFMPRLSVKPNLTMAALTRDDVVSIPKPAGDTVVFRRVQPRRSLHDGDRESLWRESGTKGVMSSLGFYPTMVERPRNKLEAIAAARTALPAESSTRGAAAWGWGGFEHTGGRGTRAGASRRTGPSMTPPGTGRTSSSPSPAATTGRPRPTSPRSGIRDGWSDRESRKLCAMIGRRERPRLGAF